MGILLIGYHTQKLPIIAKVLGTQVIVIKIYYMVRLIITWFKEILLLSELKIIYEGDLDLDLDFKFKFCFDSMKLLMICR